MKLSGMLLAGPAFAALAFASPAIAHPKLVSSSPAANATVSKPTSITLTYSEKLLAPMSGIELTMTGMPGMANHAPMKVAGFQTSVVDKAMTVALPRPLPAGTYALKWHAAGADTHRIEGSFTFAVK